MATKKAKTAAAVDAAVLSPVRKALESGDARAALAATIDAWNATKLPALAELAHGITARATKGWATPAVTERDDPAPWHAAWLERCGRNDPLDVDRLAPGVMRPPLGDLIIARVHQLMSRPPDPRIVDAALAMVLEPPATAQSIIGKLWEPVFRVLEASRDPRLAAPLTKYVAKKPGGASKFWPKHYAKVERLLKKLDPLPEPDAALTKELKTLAALAGSLGAAKEDSAPAPTVKPKGGDPLSVVYASPSSLEARLVAADAFLEKNDARGTAIQLEHAVIRGDATAAQQKQLRELVKHHAEQWIPAELKPVLTPKEYSVRLGFLDSCEVVTTSNAQRDAIVDHPGWSTVRTLLCDELPLLTSPAFKALEKVGGFALETLYALGTSPRPLPVTSAGLVVVMQLPPVVVKERGPAPWTALPKLRELELIHSYRFGSRQFENSAFSQWTWLADLPIAGQLEALSVLVHPKKGTDGWEQVFELLPKLQRLTLVGVSQHRWTFFREGKDLAVRVGVSDSRLEKTPDLVDNHHARVIAQWLPAFKKAGAARVEIVDTLQHPNKTAIARLTELLAQKSPLPLTHVPGSFPPGDGTYELIAYEMKRAQRFARAARSRK